MQNSKSHDVDGGLEGRNCVPYFKNDKNQIVFEFFYLLLLLIIGCTSVAAIQFYGNEMGVSHSNKQMLFALLGGFLGGWVYDAKWFYRVTARGKNNQYKFLWQSHKFYWRILTPFLSALVAFAAFLLILSDILPVVIKNKESAKISFSVCFLFGYFSDLLLSRLAAWAEKIIPKVNNNG